MEKGQIGLELLENPKVNSIVEAAIKEFSINGIINTKIKDIAVSAKVGEATLYRYFKDKETLAKLVALYYWSEEAKLYFDYNKEYVVNKTLAIDKIKAYLGMFNVLYKEQIAFLKFMEDYDNYMISMNKIVKHEKYDDQIIAMRDEFKKIIELGKMDGSVRKDANADDLYDIIAYSIIPTLQKLANRTGYSETHSKVDAIRVLESICGMFVENIKRKEC